MRKGSTAARTRMPGTARSDARKRAKSDTSISMPGAVIISEDQGGKDERLARIVRSEPSFRVAKYSVRTASIRSNGSYQA